MKIALTVSLLLVSAVVSLGQSRTPSPDAPEFGELSEIAKLKTVYVYCRDLKIRQAIVDEIRKEPALEIVGRVDDAKIVINYDYDSVTHSRDRGILGTSTKTAQYNGDLTVSIAGTVDDQNRVRERIVWSVGKDRKKSLGKNPYIKATRAFLEDYRRMMRESARQ